MPDMNPQQMTDIEQAKAKLNEVQETKEGRKDPRAGEQMALVTRQTLPGGRVPDEARDIKAGKVPPKKPGFGRRLKEALFGENIGNGKISEYIFFDVIIPAGKKLVYESLNTALCMVLNLDPKTNKIFGQNNANPHTSRASVYRERSYGQTMNSHKPILYGCEWEESIAKDYFDQIIEVADKYGDVSISNVLSICGMGDQIKTTDKNWGWTKAMMIKADVYPIDLIGERWYIDLPEPRPLR